MATTFAYNSAGYGAGVNLWGLFTPNASKWKGNITSNYISAINDGYHMEFVANCTQAQLAVFGNSAQTFLCSVDGAAPSTLTCSVTGTNTLTLATGLTAGNHLFRIQTNGTGELFGDLTLTGGTESLVSVAKSQIYFNTVTLAQSPLYSSGVPVTPLAMWGAWSAVSSNQNISLFEYNSAVISGRFVGSGLDIMAFYDSNISVLASVDGGPYKSLLFAPGGVSGNYGWTNIFAGLSSGTHRFRLYAIGGSTGNSIWAAMRTTNSQTLNGAVSAGGTALVLNTVPAAWAAGHWLYVGYEGNVGHGEWQQIASISGSTVNLVGTLANAHASGDPVHNACDTTAGSFLAPDEAIGTTADPNDLTKIYHPANGKVVVVGDSISQQKSTDLTGAGPYTPVYITYDDRFSWVRRYCVAQGYDLINLAHQGDATANVVTRKADIGTRNTTGAQRYVVLLGTNDSNTSVAVSTFQTNYQAIIDQIAAGAPANSVILCVKIFSPTNKDNSAYNAAIDAVASASQTTYPNLVIQSVNIVTAAAMNATVGNDMFDTLHPNDAGTTKMANALPALFASTSPGTPAKPGSTLGNIQVTVTWSAVSLATSYRLRRNGTIVFDGNALTYTDSVAEGSAPSYTVSAYNAVGESSQSTALVVQAGGGTGGRTFGQLRRGR